MIILLSATRKDLIADVMDEMALPFEAIPCTSLTKFVTDSLAMLGHTKCIICDLESMNDADDNIVDSMTKIKSLYPDLRLVAISDIEDRSALFRRLYDKEIYNLIDAANMADLKAAICKGLDQTAVAKKYETAIPDLTVSDSILPIRSSKTEEADEPPKEEILANKEFKQYEKCIHVGVCGTKSGVGTTHIALQITKFLSDIGFRACYLEATEKRKIAAMQAYPNTMRTSKGYLQYNGINIYHDFRMSEVQNANYDFFVYDRGVLNELTTSAFLYCPIQILVGDGKVWDMELLQHKMQEINSDRLKVVLNFATANDISLLTSAKDVFFSAADPDPFVWTGNREIWKTIFARYVTVRTNEPRADPPQAKRKFFSWRK